MAGVFALGSFIPASASDTTGTKGTPEQRWYIGSGNAYGKFEWDDRGVDNDVDNLNLYDDVIPAGYSVKMKVVHGSFKKTVSASHNGWETVHIPNFTRGEKATVTACAWDNGEIVKCREETITE